LFDPKRLERRTIWGAVVTVAVLCTVAILGVAWALWSSDTTGRTLDSRVLDAIEADSGFVLLPPNAAVTSAARRAECTDSSGDGPIVWHKMTVGGTTATEVVAYYKSTLPGTGWEFVREGETDNPGSDLDVTSMEWFRKVDGHDVALRIYVDVHTADTTVEGHTSCGPS
jgi:hypothetical protein